MPDVPHERDLLYACCQVKFDTGPMVWNLVIKIEPAEQQNSPLLPDIPTSHEQGVPEFDIAPFYAVFVPTARRRQWSRSLRTP